jgi:hypothetical protein
VIGSELDKPCVGSESGKRPVGMWCVSHVCLCDRWYSENFVECISQYSFPADALDTSSEDRGSKKLRVEVEISNLPMGER